MDLSDIFNNDMFITEMINCMSSREMFFYRQITKYTYKNITNDIIINKAIECIHQRLRNTIDNYDKFLKFIEKREIIFYGEFVLQCLLGEYWDEFPINVTTDKWDKICEDYKKKVDEKIIGVDELDKCLDIGIFLEGTDEIVLNNYETKINKQILLLAVYDYGFDNCENTSTNKFMIKNGKSILEINNLNKTMHKGVVIDLSKEPLS